MKLNCKYSVCRLVGHDLQQVDGGLDHLQALLWAKTLARTVFGSFVVVPENEL